MQHRETQSLGKLSVLALGGGGIGQVYCATTREESIATVHEAVDSGINVFDVAPSYGQGEAETVVRESFGGRVPKDVHIFTKFGMSSTPSDRIESALNQSVDESLTRMKLEKVDVLFSHDYLVPDESDVSGVTVSQYREVVRPALEKLVCSGKAMGWGLTGLGIPSVLIDMINEDPPPHAIQVATNLLDTLGVLRHYDVPPRPRDIMAAAQGRGVAVMGIYPLAAGALTDQVDREMPQDSATMVDYRRAVFLRAMAKEMEQTPAALALRYALTMKDVSSVVVGVKNRTELRECIAAESRGPLGHLLVNKIDQAAR